MSDMKYVYFMKSLIHLGTGILELDTTLMAVIIYHPIQHSNNTQPTSPTYSNAKDQQHIFRSSNRCCSRRSFIGIPNYLQIDYSLKIIIVVPGQPNCPRIGIRIVDYLPIVYSPRIIIVISGHRLISNRLQPYSIYHEIPLHKMDCNFELSGVMKCPMLACFLILPPLTLLPIFCYFSR